MYVHAFGATVTPEQESSLISGGDCFAHYHSEDRRPTHSLLQGLNEIASRVQISGNFTLTGDENYVLVDTRAGNVTITLPKAKNQLEIEILKQYSPYSIIIQPGNIVDTILKQTNPVTLSTVNASLRFKAMGIDWRII